ncbi:MAG: exodeoxyribonuclease III [Candidatus Heimdallarchaeota archaeon]|nr:exodeoxyribonuclease III [Candidatus Heimdallarchaeota archaeon]
MTTYKLFSWNVNGIRATLKTNQFQQFTDSHDFNILCLQETKISADKLTTELKYPENHYTTWAHATKSGYSGVANYYKKPLQPKETSISIGKDEFDNEGRVIIAKFNEFTLLNVYFPNGKQSSERLDYKMRFYDHFSNFCKQLQQKGEKIVICGDVNTAHSEIDLSNPKSNAKNSGFLPIEREWLTKFLKSGYTDTLRHFNPDTPELYTWWAVRAQKVDGKTPRERNIGWRIDYFIISNDLLPNLRSANIHPDVMGSDHCPISIELQF